MKDIERILLIRFGSLGDVVLTLPVLQAVREHFPDAYIAMLVGDASADIVSADPRLDEVIKFRRHAKKSPLFQRGLGGFKRLSEAQRIITLLRERSFNVSIDMQRKFQSSLFAYLGNVVCRIGYHYPGGFLCTIRVPDRGNKHAVDRNLELLAPLGISGSDRRPRMYLSREDRDYARRVFADYDLTSEDLILGIFPGAGWRQRCWPAERFASIADLAVGNYNAKVVIFCGPGEADIVDNITQRMETHAVVVGMPPSFPTLRQLAAMIERCDLFLSNDTGPMHISVAVDTATIALFGPGNHVKFRPLGEKHVLIRKDVPCSPCKQFTDRCKDNVCMKLITVDEVWEVVSQRLSKAVR